MHSRLFHLSLIFFAAILCDCASKPSEGILELRRSRDAIRAAKSWQSGTTVQMPSGQWVILSLEKVECPARQDRTAVVHELQNMSVHEIWWDGDYYNKTTGVGSSGWTSVPHGVKPLMTDCGQGPLLTWDGTLYSDLDSVAQTGEVRRGQSSQLEGTACIWWDVASVPAAAPHYSVCISDDGEHLPIHVRSHEHNLNYMYTYTNWNSTTVTLPPDLPSKLN